jgi:hypothetical protein
MFRSRFACAEQGRQIGDPTGSNAEDERNMEKNCGYAKSRSKGKEKGAYNKNLAITFLGEPQNCPNV